MRFSLGNEMCGLYRADISGYNENGNGARKSRMLKKGCIADLKSGALTKAAGHIVVPMCHYPRGLRKTLIDEYVKALAPDKTLLDDFHAARERLDGNHNLTFRNCKYQQRFSISADGGIVSFGTRSTNLVAGDTNGWDDIFVHDCATGATTRVSVASDGSQANHRSFSPTISADGRFVAAWSTWNSTGPDGNAEGIRAQVFNSNGTKSGAEFQVNTTTIGAQFQPAISLLNDGDFVVTWTDLSGTGGDQSQQAVRAQIFNPSGAPVGSEFLVNTTTIDDQNRPTITSLTDGRFVAAWTDLSETGADTDGRSVRAQVFNANGTKSGTEFLVNTTTASDQYSPTIAGLLDGRFVAAWTSADFGSNQTIRAQVFNSDGTKSSAEFVVDCEVCCRPMTVTVTLQEGEIVGLDVAGIDVIADDVPELPASASRRVDVERSSCQQTADGRQQVRKSQPRWERLTNCCQRTSRGRCLDFERGQQHPDNHEDIER